MSAIDDPAGPEGGERESLAGEYALGLLEGQDLLAVRGLLASDPGFAQDVAAWEARLAPLFAAIAPAVPPQRVWAAIAAAMRDQPRSDEVVRLKRQVWHWRAGTGIAAALAGVLAIVGLQPRREAPPVSGPVAAPSPVVAPPLAVAPPPAAAPSPVATPASVAPAPVAPSPVAPPPRIVVAPPTVTPPPVVVSATPPLAAALAPKGGGTIGVVYHREDRRLVALAEDLKPRDGHDLELWLLLPDGTPLPLGVIAAGTSRQLPLTAETAAQIVPGSTIAVSLEPVGGSPTGLPTGPVLATAKIVPA